MQAHPFIDQRPLFKAYDIRGDNTLFTTDFITALSDALACHFLCHPAMQKVVIGYDIRHGSHGIAVQLADSFIRHGIEVIWLGMVTTPIMAFWANKYDGNGLIATASHSKRHINGIKWLINGQSPSSESIQSLYNQLSPTNTNPANSFRASSKLTLLDSKQVSEAYINEATEALAKLNSQLPQLNPTLTKTVKPLKVVIDCLNGATGPFAELFFNQHSQNNHSPSCHQVIMLNDTPNADFPKGNPDPLEDNRLDELGDAVLHHQADIGLSFDGDGDRLMVVDNEGKAIAPDYLLYLLARIAVEEHRLIHKRDNNNDRNDQHPDSNPTVIFDVKCSHHLPQLIEQIGAKGQMSKTGSSILRRALQSKDNSQKEHILFAGELSGHFIFNDGHFIVHDDAMYAGLRLINWLSRQSLQSVDQETSIPLRLTDIINCLPPMVSTSDVYLPLNAYQSQDTGNAPNKPTKSSQPILRKLANICQKLQSGSLNYPVEHTSDMRLTCIDGIRLDFEHGFGIIRSSNTSNSLTVRFAGDSLADLERIQNYFVELCQSISMDLARQVAKIAIKT